MLHVPCLVLRDIWRGEHQRLQSAAACYAVLAFVHLDSDHSYEWSPPVKLLVASILVGLTLSGCIIHDHGRYDRRDRDSYHDRDDRFCPPGQAKKGNC